MSYTMTHLVTADQYTKRHGMTYSEAALFLLASFSPDSVHADPNYDPAMKERSHFMPEDIKWGDIYKEEQMNSWYESVRAFYRSRYSPSLLAMELAFLQGYAHHLLVDIFNCQWFYSPNLIQYELNVKAFRRDYREQCLNYDHFLYQNYEHTEDVFQKLNAGIELLEQYPIFERLNLQNEILCNNIKEKIKLTEQEYITSNRVLMNMEMITVEDSQRFIEEMRVQCDKLLFKFPEKEHLFKVNTKCEINLN